MMETINFGPNEDMILREPLDTWLSAGMRDYAVPEAAGSSARVFSVNFTLLNGEYADYPVVKIMRPDRTLYARPLFENEVKILAKLGQNTGMTPLLGTGFFQVSEGRWPDEIAPLSSNLLQEASASHLTGTVDFFSPNEVDLFLSELDSRVEEGQLAAIFMPRRWEDNLYLRCDAGYTRGEYIRTFPVRLALHAAMQICQIIQTAHENEIVYLDHKALHYYWNDPRQQVFALDWNIGRLVTNGNVQDIYKFDILQFCARALHHLMTGRQAQGSVNVGPNKPEEIQNAPKKYEPIWTFDDHERLTQEEIDFLSNAIQGQYETIPELLNDLQTLHKLRLSES
jgi:hypothetical protein